LIASRTDSSGATLTSGLEGLLRRSSDTVFMAISSKTGDRPGFSRLSSRENSGSVPLHVRVVRPATALGHDPLDVLLRALDVAGLAVHAVLGVDLKARRPVLRDELVHSSRTVARLGPVVNGQVDRYRDRRVLELQVRGLVFLVVGVRDEHRGE